ncbi:MAG: hypothetical protein OQK54_00940 [Gammaproteobacteria bacterium]|nr:hypothetical protein [Gammaproteobacteria bacterium]
MSDNQHRDIFEQEGPSQNALLNELDSLRELLDEEIDSTAAITSVSDIRSVKEYMLLKQEADKAGLDLDTWLAQRAGATQSKAGENEEESLPQNSAEEAIPLLDEVVEVEDMPFGAGEEIESPAMAAGGPTTESEEIYAAARAALESPNSTLETLEQMVAQLVEQKLQALKPELQKQIFDELRGMLPVDLFK